MIMAGDCLGLLLKVAQRRIKYSWQQVLYCLVSHNSCFFHQCVQLYASWSRHEKRHGSYEGI